MHYENYVLPLGRFARMMVAMQSLGQRSGMVLAVPIPPMAAASGEMVESAIEQALQEAKCQGIKGHEVDLPAVLSLKLPFMTNSADGDRPIHKDIIRLILPAGNAIFA
jgi:pseudouridine-5'-phosphate glycosidase